MGCQICAAKRFLRQKLARYRAPNLDLHSDYWWLHSLKISCDSAAWLWRNAVKTFHHTVVCVTIVTVPVHLHGTNAPFLLLTRRCYDAETSAILLLLNRALIHMISFLKSFGEVIVSSNLRETKGYSPGFFFCGPKKSAEKSKPF